METLQEETKVETTEREKETEKEQVTPEGYLEACFNETEFKKYWFYLVRGTLYVKREPTDYWFEYGIPLSSIYEVKKENENTFKLCTITLNITCKTEKEEEVEFWTKLLTNSMEEKKEITLSDAFHVTFHKTKNLDLFLDQVLSSLLESTNKWEVNQNELLEKITEILRKKDEESEVHLDKVSYSGKKVVQMSEVDFEKFRLKNEKVEKLEMENFELNKKLNKLSLHNDLKVLNEEEINLANKKIAKFQEFIKLKDNKIKELINSEAKFQKDIKNIEMRMEEVQKSEERIKQEKLTIKSVETKNKELELFFQAQATKLEQVNKELEEEKIKSKNLEGEKKSTENTLQKFKDREKQLVSVIQMYELSTPTNSTPSTPIPSTLETKKSRKSFGQPKELEKSESFFGKVGGLFKNNTNK
jgi:DNA repair exonuclease SbcCD ATPase subunit